MRQKKIALTFDDGPNEPYTSEILKILKDNHVHATFFMLGKNVETFPAAARAVAEEGHAIGNHSYDHRDLIKRTTDEVQIEITKGEAAIEKVVGRRTNLFRPPYGDRNPWIQAEIRALGFVTVEWSSSAEDWRKPGVQNIVDRVMKEVRNGAIILMHDGDKTRHGSDRSQTVEALPIVIKKLQDDGYEFVTIPELLKLSSPVGPLAKASAP